MFETDEDHLEAELFKLVAVGWLAIAGAAAMVAYVLV